MFLVSNTAMVKEACKAGITGAIPALNYRTIADLKKSLAELDSCGYVYGINLIVNRSNYKLRQQLEACLNSKVSFIITSLGSPKDVIQACRPRGIKVFCDVSNMNYAAKTYQLKPDALIAVTNEAGGHLGELSPETFIPQLLQSFPDMPIISAGGVGDRAGLDRMLSLGAAGVSVGSIFIASEESPVIMEYKNACVNYGAKDIVTTTKLSGVPCTVINTPYVQQIGTRASAFQRLIHKNRWLKKWFKMLTYKTGMDVLRRAAFDATYNTVWCAGQSIEYTKAIEPVRTIVARLVKSDSAQ